jgi:hypothetical protein
MGLFVVSLSQPVKPSCLDLGLMAGEPTLKSFTGNER